MLALQSGVIGISGDLSLLSDGVCSFLSSSFLHVFSTTNKHTSIWKHKIPKLDIWTFGHLQERQVKRFSDQHEPCAFFARSLSAVPFPLRFNDVLYQIT